MNFSLPVVGPVAQNTLSQNIDPKQRLCTLAPDGSFTQFGSVVANGSHVGPEKC
ncbi:hypothetical protein SRABI106_02730 [Rahnella aquatilis]|nr:hypothetical protein SRABI106_02730 [Rahnella aquatilis]